MALSGARLLYGPAFEPLIALKALSHFGDGDLHLLPDAIRSSLLAAVAATDLDRLPVLERQDAKDADGSRP